MGQRTIPDGAAVTNHYTVSFAPHVEEAEATEVSGISDDHEIIAGPDERGFATGKRTMKELTVKVPSHTVTSTSFHKWKDACEHGAPGHNVTGTIGINDAGDNPIAVWELEDCKCFSVEQNSLSIGSPEVSDETFKIKYSKATRVMRVK